MTMEFEEEVKAVTATEEESSFIDDLREYMEETEVQDLEIETEKQGFEISNREQAGFFIRKVQEIRLEMDRVNFEANKEATRLTDRIDEWRVKEINRCSSVEAYLVSMLELFASKELENEDKKSLKLPFGTLSFKKVQDKYEYDDKTVIDWLKANNHTEFVRIKEELNKADLKKTAAVKDGGLAIDGKQVDGITVTPQETKFEVK